MGWGASRAAVCGHGRGARDCLIVCGRAAARPRAARLCSDPANYHLRNANNHLSARGFNLFPHSPASLSFFELES